MKSDYEIIAAVVVCVAVVGWVLDVTAERVNKVVRNDPRR